MRQIKFRGKRIDDSEWVIGYYVADPEGRHRIYWQPFADATSNTYHFVDPDTVGQFTGLQDKNGKDVYEGDVMLSAGTRGEKYVVYFIDGAFRIKSIRTGITSYTKGNIENQTIASSIYEAETIK